MSLKIKRQMSITFSFLLIFEKFMSMDVFSCDELIHCIGDFQLSGINIAVTNINIYATINSTVYRELITDIMH